MFSLRRSLSGLLAVLFAIAAQLGVAATVPQANPVQQLNGFLVLCHPGDPGTPAHTPAHPPDCLVCPLCAAAHAPAPTLAAEPVVFSHLQVLPAIRRALLPSARAPPERYAWAPSQPRAPPHAS